MTVTMVEPAAYQEFFDEVSVAVVGPTTLHKGELEPHLPPLWTVTHHRHEEIGDPDLLVLLAPTEALVRDARRRRPDTAILAVLSLLDPAGALIGVVHAGADAGVRTDSAATVAEHLRACRRRQLAPPQWSAAIVLDPAC